ncbi:MAG: DUF4338 domain-containing protein [Proteobacteria bacterium]|nr:DUF4338 domain-containing protein [Pseudomonadota bacterium]
MDKTEEFKQYLAGFFDGDGSIGIEKLSAGGYCLRIKFCQSNLNWVRYIQTVYPFLHCDGRFRRVNNKCEYQLRAAGKQIEPLLEDLLPYSILKYNQLLEAKNFIPWIGKLGCSDQKQKIYMKLKELKRNTNNLTKPYQRISIPYIAGLFDAEGCIMMGKSLIVKVTQKSDTNILNKIGEYFQNTNKMSNHALIFYGNKCRPFLHSIQPYCIYKQAQIQHALYWLNGELSHFEVKSILKEHKKIDIKNMTFSNQEQHRQYLTRCWEAFDKLSTEDLWFNCKQDEISKMKTMIKFEKKIFNLDDWSSFQVAPILEFCETPNQLNMYQYYRKKVSSLPFTGVIGRSIRILVKDTISGMYLGIMCLSSDVYYLGGRDKYLEWNETNKKHLLNNVMNLSCCVPLQPFGYNTNGGKLLAKLAFSREVYEYYLKKYHQPLLGIITTSINGKSIQYDRLGELKFIGYTKGFGSVYIPNNIYQMCVEYNNQWKIITRKDRIDRFSFLKQIVSHIGLNKGLLNHGKQRGIYYGYVFSTKFDTLNPNTDELKQVSKIYQDWYSRWAQKRIDNLLRSERIKTDLCLYNSDYFEMSNYKKLIMPDVDAVISDEFIEYALTFKTERKTLTDICRTIQKDKNIVINPNTLSKIYNGKIEPKECTMEYKQLMLRTRPRISSKRQLTDEQIYLILDERKQGKTYKDISDALKTNHSWILSKASISDVVLQKIKPLSDRKLVEQNQTTSYDYNTLLDKLSNEQMMFIIKAKAKRWTTQQASDECKKVYQIRIPRNVISMIWLGKIKVNEQLQNTIEYCEMLENKKRRTKQSKFTETEIEWIQRSSGSLSYIVDRFRETFNKTITKTYVSKLRKANQ